MLFPETQPQALHAASSAGGAALPPLPWCGLTPTPAKAKQRSGAAAA
ncbi:hypothetical protein [Porphyromonas sp. oral taxon 275]|nr:hypothetical protein [Porphyromonas sp. oral taxon 275]QUB42801.1 hypothetical protein J4862_07325 [Porphyromonas sp. oral taxon 275]